MAKTRRFNDSWLEEAVVDRQWLALSMAFKDAVADGTDEQFLRELQQVVKRKGVVLPEDAEAWRIFFVDTIPLLREEMQHYLTTQREFLPPGAVFQDITPRAGDLVEAQRKLNAKRGRRK